MAGDWIKMRTDLRDDPAVIAIAVALGIEEDHVVGKLHRLWSWANRQTCDGNAPGVSESWIDRYIGVTGFGLALRNVGWLLVENGGISIPHFDRHNGESAKQRALTAKRVANHRERCNAKANATSVTNALPEKRREEKRREDKSTPISPQGGNGVCGAPSVEEVRGYCRERGNTIDPQEFVDYYQSRGWRPANGKGQIADWRATVRCWEKRNKDRKPEPTATDDDLPDVTNYTGKAR